MKTCFQRTTLCVTVLLVAVLLVGCLGTEWEKCGLGYCKNPEYVCSNMTGTCILAERDKECGNGVVDDGEECDTASDTDCYSLCLKIECGNNRTDPGEQCDDGNTAPDDGCSPDCRSNYTCPNGIVDPGEICDDGNDVSGDGCRSDCLSDESCGNWVIDVELGELCDDGNTENGDGCRRDCRSLERCGDNVMEEDEVCDDGNNLDGDGCSADCESDETCGNGIVDHIEDEVCDDGNQFSGDGCSTACDSDETCGNGVPDSAAGEVCDDGNTTNGDGCNSRCDSNETCGNGVIDEHLGEVCDLGEDNNMPGLSDYCSASCNSDGRCGNGILDPGEECDCGSGSDHASGTDCAGTQNSDMGGFCKESCTRHCGDGELASDEVCDTALADASCVDLRHDFGRAVCSPTCDRWLADTCGDWGWESHRLPGNLRMNTVSGAEGGVVALGVDTVGSANMHQLQGQSWHSIDVSTSPSLPSADRFADVWAPTADDVFGIWQYTDGGGPASRVVQLGSVMPGAVLPEPIHGSYSSFYLNDLWGVGPDEFYAAGYGTVSGVDNAVILKYSLGTWLLHHDDSQLQEFNSVWSTTSQVTAVSEEGRLVRIIGSVEATYDCGGTPLRAVWGASRDDIHVVGDMAQIWHFDGMQCTAVQVAPPLDQSIVLRDVIGTDANDVFTVGDQGTVLHYDGATWQSISVESTKNLTGVWPRTANEVFVVGSQSEILRFGGGARQVLSSTGDELSAASGNDDGDVYAIEQTGVVLKLEDDTWMVRHTSPGSTLNDIWVGKEEVIVVGVDDMDQGVTLHWKNDMWALQPNQVSGPIISVWGRADNDVFALSANAIIHYDGVWSPPLSLSGGKTATFVTGTSQNDVQVVLKETTIDCAGGQGSVLYQLQGTTTLSLGMSYQMPGCMQVRDGWSPKGSDALYLVGENELGDGVILLFTGLHIQEMATSPVESLYAVWGHADDDIYAVGDNGTLLHHDGVGWLPVNMEPARNLRDIWSASRHAIYVLDDDGASERLIFTAPPR